MLAFIIGLLIAIRDVLIAAALAWVGISIERVEGAVETERACATDACRLQAD